jgi:hypothetical protein
MTSLKRKLGNVALAVTPRPIWNVYLRARGLPQVRPERVFDHMRTIADPAPLLTGRFAAIQNKYNTVNPTYSPDTYRYRNYNACYFANLCRKVPGDFVIAGVSYGATAKVLYEFLDFPTLGKTLHLVDPFDAKNAVSDSRIADHYNQNDEYVRRLFPSDAPIEIHKQPIPIDLSRPLAFVLCDTGDIDSDVSALPNFYKELSLGGVWMTFIYGRDTTRFQKTFTQLGVFPLWLPSGQGVIIKQ